jgi:hypothetical protein
VKLKRKLTALTQHAQKMLALITLTLSAINAVISKDSAPARGLLNDRVGNLIHPVIQSRHHRFERRDFPALPWLFARRIVAVMNALSVLRLLRGMIRLLRLLVKPREPICQSA